MNLPPRLKAWQERHWIVGSLDFLLGLAVAIVVFVVGLARGDIRDRGITFLLVEAGAAAAFLGVVLTALAILVAFLDRAYVKLLRESVTIPVTMRPYRTVATVSGAAAFISLGGALVYPALLPGAQALVLALSAGFTAWSIAGTVGIVRITAWHGGMRSRMGEIPEAAQRALDQRKGA